MEQSMIEIAPEIPRRERRAAAEIYYHAFGAKLGPIIGEATRAIPLLAEAIDPERGIAALIEGQLVGVAGLHHQRRQLVQLRFADLARHFGIMSAIWRYTAGKLFTRTPRATELLMDGIAVAGALRGRGVGTRLLSAVVAFGRAHGYTSVRLDVVDTNAGARRLYERFGFVPAATHAYPFMRPFGFTAVTTMRLPIAR
jgi:GNAT superfamily N-acetyltransferase